MSDNLDFSTLVDFALGRLSPEESLKILDQLETNPQASHDLELIIKLIDYFRKEGDLGITKD